MRRALLSEAVDAAAVGSGRNDLGEANAGSLNGVQQSEERSFSGSSLAPHDEDPTIERALVLWSGQKSPQDLLVGIGVNIDGREAMQQADALFRCKCFARQVRTRLLRRSKVR
jgi:hypothetical protein